LNRFSCIAALHFGFFICSEKIACTKELVNHFYKKLKDQGTRHKAQGARQYHRHPGEYPNNLKVTREHECRGQFNKSGFPLSHPKGHKRE
jgi:hypothetical protein